MKRRLKDCREATLIVRLPPSRAERPIVKNKQSVPRPGRREPLLEKIRNGKMARSPGAYVRGNTVRYYEWLERVESGALPEGPAIWICGDCHVGNLGPVGNARGKIEIQIRDLDQTVIGNPAHDLIRLSLSLASAARGSDLPGLTTVKMLERIMHEYHWAFAPNFDENRDLEEPEPVRRVAKKAATASWKSLAAEDLEGTNPTLPIGKCFWPLSQQEKRGVEKLLADEEMHRLATRLRSREDNEDVKLVDAAYWVKGCSSLGRSRYAVLLHVGNEEGYCLLDLKEAVKAAAPHAARARMPSDQAERVVEGARHLSPYLGDRMLAAKLDGSSVFVRELMPQDRKIEVEQLTSEEAIEVAGFLAAVVGKAHGRQMDASTRDEWRREVQRSRSKSLNAPGWLWTSLVELLADHERGYLDHCRQFALEGA
jgi:uncharacterized protein (DUF2252 family)